VMVCVCCFIQVTPSPKVVGDLAQFVMVCVCAVSFR